MSAEIVDNETGEVFALPALGGAAVSSVSLVLPDGLSFGQWSEIGGTLKRIERSVLWWIGDWLRYGERRYGETYSQAIEASGYDIETCRAAKWVSEKIETVRRRTDLSWSHHKEVAALSQDAQDDLLDRAATQQWSRNELRAEVYRLKNRIGADPTTTETCTTDDLTALIAAGMKYGTVYADPPWQYGNQGTRAATGRHYGGMAVDEICALPIADLVAPDAHLHLWTTNGFLFDCKRIIEAWGFEYKSCFVWVKPSMGIGNYWRVSHEFMLFGVRGSAPFRDRSLMSWAEFPRGEHSAKPEQIRQMIERASPGPWLELFGRHSHAPGWTIWGDGIERNLFHAMAKEVA